MTREQRNDDIVSERGASGMFHEELLRAPVHHDEALGRRSMLKGSVHLLTDGRREEGIKAICKYNG